LFKKFTSLFPNTAKDKKSNYLSIEKFKWVIPSLVVDRILYEPIAGEYDNPRAAIGK
jgi:hypothetical protein